jgi:hypothetical protein
VEAALRGGRATGGGRGEVAESLETLFRIHSHPQESEKNAKGKARSSEDSGTPEALLRTEKAAIHHRHSSLDL